MRLIGSGVSDWVAQVGSRLRDFRVIIDRLELINDGTSETALQTEKKTPEKAFQTSVITRRPSSVNPIPSRFFS